MTYVRFDIKKLIVTDKTIFEGHAQFDNDVTICGDLILGGKLNDILIGDNIATTPQYLLGMWPMTRASGKENTNHQFANFDGIIGEKNSRDFFHPLNEWNQLSQQFTPGKNLRTLSYFFEETNAPNNQYLATVNIDDGLITYLSTMTNNARGPVYDSVNDRFLAFHAGGDTVYTFDPTTGTPNVLQAAVGTTLTEIGDGIIIGDTAFFSEIDSGKTIQIDPIFTAVNKNTGLLIANISWTGNYIFSGSTFSNIGLERILSLALDPNLFKLYFLLGNDKRRYLGYYQASSLSQLESDILSGSFNITLCEQIPSEPISSIVWVLPDLEN